MEAGNAEGRFFPARLPQKNAVILNEVKDPVNQSVILSELRAAAAGGRERRPAISVAAPLCGLSRSRHANGNSGKVYAKDPVRLRWMF